MSSNLCALIKKVQTKIVGIEDTMRLIPTYRKEGEDSLSVQIGPEIGDCIIFADYEMKLHLRD